MSILNSENSTPRQDLDLSVFGLPNAFVSMAREDLVHPSMGGNKFRKLRYNVKQARKDDHGSLLTFGGAYSNHILAVAKAGDFYGLKTIGVIRGEELQHKWQENPTLHKANELGMQLCFVSRQQYQKRAAPDTLAKLRQKHGEFYHVPEGGTNELAVRGCEEILSLADGAYDYICVPVGTGGTAAGLLRSLAPGQKLFGFSALQGTFQKEIIGAYAPLKDFMLTDAHCFGGYAKIDAVLVRFINEFKAATGIPLDPVYTGKMMYGIIQMLKNGEFRENSRILAIHTGGLQGIAGMNSRLKKKNLPLLHE